MNVVVLDEKILHDVSLLDETSFSVVLSDSNFIVVTDDGIMNVVVSDGVCC